MYVVRTLKILALALAAVGMMFLPSVAAASAGGNSSPAEGVPAFGHVFLIIGENTGLNQINKSDMPYLVGMVKPASAWLINYSGVTHFSEANYIAMTSGQFTSCEQNDGAPASCHQNVPNLFAQLDSADVTLEGVGGNPCRPAPPSTPTRPSTIRRSSTTTSKAQTASGRRPASHPSA